MATRSRNGCIDCKRAKVKCDEVHPSCGTCKRRGRQCSGYNQTTKSRSTREATAMIAESPAITSPSSEVTVALTSLTPLPSTSECRASDSTFYSPSVLSPASPDLAFLAPAFPSSAKETIPLVSPRLRNVTIIPSGAINPADEPFIELYFLRHPKELVFGPEFEEEMNSSVMKVFLNSPLAVSDSLSAIGEAYAGDSSLPVLVPLPHRKARILARLRSMDNLGVSLELLLTVMLGLCAVEVRTVPNCLLTPLTGSQLIDANEHDHHVSSLPVLLDNLAMMLDRHFCHGFELSQLSKYFVRALARQDMMLSLTRFRRPRISTAYWLDDYAQQHADRFMGYTSTLMPLLGELSALAENIHALRDENLTVRDRCVSSFKKPFYYPPNLLDRASRLRSQLELWHPTVDRGLSFQPSRKFLMHANAYRSAALLYLHRLLHPPGSSADADHLAQTMAYEVMVHTTSSDDDMKMALWPVFLASCEMNTEADRTSVTCMFKSICRGRKTVTTTRTRSFVAHRVWAARDAGMEWNWMALSLQYPNELLPI